MMTRKAVISFVLAVGIGANVATVVAQAPVGTTFTYQGRLTDGGQPYEGTADLTFRMFDAETGGNQVGPDVVITGHSITDGLVTAPLDFGPGAFLGDERWLELDVNGVPLTPRQPIRPAPYALFALDAPGGGNSPWQEAAGGIYYDSGNVGIGTADPSHVLTVQSTDDSTMRLVGNDGLYGEGARVNFGDQDNVYIEEDEGDKLYIHARVRTALMSGFVGIGTADPQQRLSVSEGMNIDQINANDGTLDSALTFGGGSGEGIASKRTSGAGQNGLDFYTNYQNRMAITQAGEVGIGTTAPDSPLHVERTTEGPAIRAVATAQGSSSHTGVSGYAYGYDASGTAYGVDGSANSAGMGIGVLGGSYGTGENYGVFGEATGGTTNYAGYFAGAVHVNGTLSKSAGTFKIDHPLDPANMYLSHSFVESPDMMNVYNGNVVTGSDGYAVVELPDYFEALNRDFRYQLTVIDETDSDAFVLAKVVRKIAGNWFTIRTSAPHVEVSWQVTGVRQDAYARHHPIVVEQDKPERERGMYLHPELYGEPEELGLHRPQRPEQEAAGADPVAPALERRGRMR